MTVGPPIDRPPDGVLELVDLHAFVKDPVAVFAPTVAADAASRTSPRPTTRCCRSSRAISTSPTWASSARCTPRGMSDAEWLHVERRTGHAATRCPREPGDRQDPRRSGRDHGRVGATSRCAPGCPTSYDVEVALDDGPRIVGSIPLLLPADRPGPARVRFTRPKPGFVLEAWLDLMVLTASDPETAWRSVSICRGGRRRPGRQSSSSSRCVGGRAEAPAAPARRSRSSSTATGAGDARASSPLPDLLQVGGRRRPDRTSVAPPGGVGRRRQGCRRPSSSATSDAELLGLPAEARDPDGSGGGWHDGPHFLWGEVVGDRRAGAA